MTGFILDWPAAAERGPGAAGGKGWQLGRMAELGLPVPDGFVIAAEASRSHGIGQPVPAPVLAAVEAEIARRGWTGRPLAVRSSAPQEDSGSASFAGIHRSHLNVRGPAAMAVAIRSVWDSAWEEPALAYRQRAGISRDDVSMAVVVMPLLDTVASGIAFTCDPLSGRDDQVVVHAHWGLGEALVGGQAQGDEYRLQERLPGQPLALVAQQRGTKQRMTRAAARGGTELAPTPAEQASGAVLTDGQAETLGALAREAACALDYAAPWYDLEWAWDGTRFWIVQARPVTARRRHTYPALQGQPGLWSRANTREVLPEPLSALEWGLDRWMVDRMLTRGYVLSGYTPLPGVRRAALHWGRLYLDASVMQWEAYDALGIAPQAINRLLGGSQPEISVPPRSARQRLRHGASMLRYMWHAGGMRRRAGRILDAARRQAAQWRQAPLPAGAPGLAHRLRERFDAMHRADDLFFLQGSAGGTLSGLVDLVGKYCPGEGHALVAALMAGGEPSVTARQAYELMELAAVAAADPPALAWLRHPGRDAAAWARELGEDSPFRRAFAVFLDRYGHRAIAESYFGSPRWREDPAYLFDMVAGFIGHDPQAQRRRQREAADQAWRRLRERAPGWALPLVRWLVKVSTQESNHREAARSALMAYLEVLRRELLAAGGMLAGPDGLARPEDVFHLTLDEIYAALEGTLAPRHAAVRAAWRRARREAWAAQREPEVLIEAAQGAVAPLPGDGRVGGRGGDAWSGTPVGTGHARGVAHVAKGPRDGVGMAPGSVLVAPSTDPAWTPLFLRAGALVMETGGYLSHGAIVAREFGIPAVANLPGILEQVATGDLLDVDGHGGTVRRIARAG